MSVEDNGPYGLKQFTIPGTCSTEWWVVNGRGAKCWLIPDCGGELASWACVCMNHFDGKSWADIARKRS